MEKIIILVFSFLFPISAIAQTDNLVTDIRMDSIAVVHFDDNGKVASTSKEVASIGLIVINLHNYTIGIYGILTNNIVFQIGDVQRQLDKYPGTDSTYNFVIVSPHGDQSKLTIRDNRLVLNYLNNMILMKGHAITQ